MLASRQNDFFVRRESRVAIRYTTPPRGGPPTAKVEAVGREALDFNDAKEIRVIRPMDHGRVVEATPLDLMLKAMLSQTPGRWGRLRPLRGFGGLVGPPEQDAEQRLRLVEFSQTLARGSVDTIDIPMAGARRLGFSMEDPHGRMIIDFGGGKTCMGVIAMGGLVAWHTAHFGGQDLDRAIAVYLERKHQLIISPEQAMEIKHQIGAVYPKAKPAKLQVDGIQQNATRAKKIVVEDQEIREVILNAMEPLNLAIQAGFRGVTPELCGDIARAGVTLVGGSALLEGLASHLSERLGIGFYVGEDPMNTVVMGAHEMLLENRGPSSGKKPQTG